jgi:hypothetical protein
MSMTCHFSAKANICRKVFGTATSAYCETLQVRRNMWPSADTLAPRGHVPWRSRTGQDCGGSWTACCHPTTVTSRYCCGVFWLTWACLSAALITMPLSNGQLLLGFAAALGNADLGDCCFEGAAGDEPAPDFIVRSVAQDLQRWTADARLHNSALPSYGQQ